MMRRTIHPVGCAQFVTESFFYDRIHVVMDCGMGRGKNSTKRLQKLVDSYFAHNGHIDYLFISHFDNDHCNGIKYLISKNLINQDTHVYIPLLSYPIIFIMDTLEGHSYAELIRALVSAKSQITFVRAIGDAESMLPEVSDIRPNDVNIINSFDPVQILVRRSPIWEYRPFYIQDKSFQVQFVIECAQEPNPINEAKLKIYQDLTDAEKDKLKDIYQNLKGNTYADGPTTINMNAMLLISREMPYYRPFCSEMFTKPYTFSPYFPFREKQLLRPSCLYTSDAGLSTQRYLDYVIAAADNYLPEGIGLLQIPHHGSYKCYNADIYRKLNFEATFINGDVTSSNPAICADAINDAYRNAIPLYLADSQRSIVQDVQ